MNRPGGPIKMLGTFNNKRSKLPVIMGHYEEING